MLSLCVTCRKQLISVTIAQRLVEVSANAAGKAFQTDETKDRVYTYIA